MFGSTWVVNLRNPRLPLPARPPIGGATGPAGFGNGDPHFSVDDPRIPPHLRNRLPYPLPWVDTLL